MPIDLNAVSVQSSDALSFRLQAVSTRLQTGHITLCVGKTGSGKSTLLDAVCGLVPLTAGNIIVDGQPLWRNQRPVAAVIRSFAIAFQSPEQQLFARTVQGEFAYSLHPLHLPKSTVKACTSASLHHVGLPPTILEQSPLALSGGQKRRVALATTYAVSPQWLLLDEPTAGLDATAVHQLSEWMTCTVQQMSQGGMLIATHDLDVFLPLADDVLLLHHGRLIRHVPVSELFAHPEWLHEIGIAPSASMQMRLALERKGFKLPNRYLFPQEVAQLIQNQAATQVANRDKCDSLRPVSYTRLTEQRAYVFGADPAYAEPLTSGHKSGKSDAKKLGFSALDPRSKWFICICLSTAMLLQSGWLGFSLSIACTGSVLFSSRIQLRTVSSYTKPILSLLFFSCILSGVRFGAHAQLGHFHGFGFSTQAMLGTGKGFIGFLCVMEICMLMPMTTSQQEMRQALSSLLAPLRRLGLPIDAFSFAASLLLRFIPMILQQLQRFSRIANARSKRIARFGQIHVRDVPAIVIPLLLAMLQLGEDFAIAMEARGYANPSQASANYLQFQLKRADWLTLAGTCLFALLLFLVRGH